MTTEEDQVHLMNISNAILEIESYTRYEDFNQFNREEETRAVVARNLMQIGGAAKLLSDDLKNRLADMDLRVLELLTNADFNYQTERNSNALWNIVKHDLPEIREIVNTVSEKLDREEDFPNELEDRPEKGLE
ncbi:MAG: HepT-like ribonuclease domain-containing protein [Cyclobacteriaceae bacterium]